MYWLKILTVSSLAPPVDGSPPPTLPLPLLDVPLDPLLLPSRPDNRLKALEPAGPPAPPLPFKLSSPSPPLPYHYIFTNIILLRVYL